MEPTDVEHCVVTTPSVLVAFTRPHTHPKLVERAPYLYGTLNYPHKDLKFIRRCELGRWLIPASLTLIQDGLAPFCKVLVSLRGMRVLTLPTIR